MDTFVPSDPNSVAHRFGLIGCYTDLKYLAWVEQAAVYYGKIEPPPPPDLGPYRVVE
jgi:hypothetical protein